MQHQFARTEMLLGSQGMERLKAARVAVFGIGGVGGYAAEALARSGVGALELIDHDQISPTNLNRQIYALHSTIGKLKTQAAKERIEDINPDCTVTCRPIFYAPETAHLFDFTQYDYVIDAIDTVTGKIGLIVQAKKAGTKIISSMGAGNKLDPSLFRVEDIFKTSVCPLARVMRRELKARGIDGVKVVYSPEPPRKPLKQTEEKLKRRSLPGSVAWVPSAAGLLLAGQVILELSGVESA